MKLQTSLILFLFLTKSIFSQSGFVYTYYSSGKIEGVLFYANEVLEGKCYWYHENGNLKAEKVYSNGKLNGLTREFDDTGLMREEISIKNGVRDGLSKYYYPNGALKSILSYENGILVKQVHIDNDPLYVAPLEAYKYANTQDRIKDNEDLFLCEGADICPKPVGGMNEIIKYLVYPEHAKLYGLEGFVTVVVSIDTFGLVKNIEVINDLGLGTKEAAIDAVKASRFLPGEKNGKVVDSKVLFKIPFILNGKILYAASVESKEQDYNSISKKSENEKPLNQQIEKKESYVKIENKTSNESKNNNILETEKKVIRKNFDCDFDICAKPKDGIKSILDNFVMPTIVKRKGIEGEVIVEATVDIYGNVRDTKVVKELGFGCDIAVEVAILQTKFEPAISKGKPIRSNVKIIIPIVQEKK